MRCSEVVLASCSVEAAQLAAALRQRPGPHPRRAHPASTTPSSVPATGPRRAVPSGLPAERAPAAVRRSDPAAQGCRRRGAGPGGDDRPPRRAPARRGRARAARAARSTWPRSRSSSTTWAWPSGCASWRPSPTSCSRPTTAPPTSASCPVARSPSGSSPSRRPRAGRRSWPRPSGGLTTLVDDGHTGPGRRSLDPRGLRRRGLGDPRRPACWPSAWPPRRWSGPAATPGPRPPPCCGPPTRSSPPSASSSVADAVDPGQVACPVADIASPEERAACDARHRALGRAPAWPKAVPWSPSTASPSSVAGTCACAGEEKDFVTVWLTIRQRTLAPRGPGHAGTRGRTSKPTFEYLLRRNADLHQMRFALGAEDAVYLVGEIPVSRGRPTTSSTASWARASPTSTTSSRRR